MMNPNEERKGDAGEDDDIRIIFANLSFFVSESCLGGNH